MASSRIGRINEEIMRELSTSIRSLKDPRVQGMITITAVDTASDLRTAKVYVSVYDKSRSKEVLKGLKSAGGFLRRQLGHPCSCAIHRSWSSRRITPLNTVPEFLRFCPNWI